MKLLAPFFTSLLLCLTASTFVDAAELRIGSATADITPDKPVALAGQFHTRVSNKPQTPIVAAAVAIEAVENGRPVDHAILISCDLVAVHHSVMTLFREHLRPLLPDVDMRKVIVSATHTHTAPVTSEIKEETLIAYPIPPGIMTPAQYTAFLIERMAQAAAKAWQGRKPGGVSWTMGFAMVGENRRPVYSDGSAQMYGNTSRPNFRHLEAGIDPGVEMLFFWDAEKRLTAVGINAACPSQEVEGRREIDADFWHDAREQLRTKLNQPDLTVLAWCGAAGDQSPHPQYRRASEERMAKLRGLTRKQELGRRLCNVVLDTLDAARADIQTQVDFGHHVRDLALPARRILPREYDDAKRTVEEYSVIKVPDNRIATLLEMERGIVRRFEQADSLPPYQMELHALRIGDVALVTNTFELYLDWGVQMKARSPALQTFVLQLTNGCGAYLPTAAAVQGGSYSGLPHVSKVGPEGGQMLVNETVSALTNLFPPRYDLVLANGRVMDPATKLDAVRHIGITGGRIAMLSTEPLNGKAILDVSKLVVAPGFIDLHAHGQTTSDLQIKAQDGVTTALDLETGVHPVAAWYESMAGTAPIHFGATVSHINARFSAFHPGLRIGHWAVNRAKVARLGTQPDGANKPADAVQLQAIEAAIRQGLDEGALGIGFGINYTPAASPAEIEAIFRIAAERKVPAFVHTRAFGIAAIREAIDTAKKTGASLHIVHVGSSAIGDMPEVLKLIDATRAGGMDLTTEVYPYTAASIRYADTRGYEYNSLRENTWPFRDWVIEALNRDLPYDQFLFQQIAGDTVGVDPATGFLVTAPLPTPPEVGQEATAIRMARFNALDEIIQNVGASMLGLTVGCARCHHHKFDPISSKDYYQTLSVFSGVKYESRPWRDSSEAALQDELKQVGQRITQVRAELAKFPSSREVSDGRHTEHFEPTRAKWVRLTVTATDATSEGPAFDEIEVWTAAQNGSAPQLVSLATQGAKATSSGAATQLGSKNEFLNDGVFGKDSTWVASVRPPAWVQIELKEPTAIGRVVWSGDRLLAKTNPGAHAKRLTFEWRVEVAEKQGEWRSIASRTEGLDANAIQTLRGLEAELAKLRDRQSKLSAVPVVFAGKFVQPEPIHVLMRGDPEQPRDLVGPGGLAVLSGFRLAADAPEQERRAAFARWLVKEAAPLTARVAVNRLWHHHFGTGLVSTPGDFGLVGARPTHPELLEWLAAQLIADGWSLKKTHRRIVMSAAYRQRAGGPDSFSRAPRRLDAEAIRDSMLAVSGQLDRTMGGEGVNLFSRKGEFDQWKPMPDPPKGANRRMIYHARIRGADDGMFKTFDLPECGQVKDKRGDSTTPLQALNLLNGRFTLEQSAALAKRVTAESGTDLTAQIKRAFHLAVARPPRETELTACLAVAQREGLETVCRALFNSNEFLFLP